MVIGANRVGDFAPLLIFLLIKALRFLPSVEPSIGLMFNLPDQLVPLDFANAYDPPSSHPTWSWIVSLILSSGSV